jgi:hypothetical protein
MSLQLPEDKRYFLQLFVSVLVSVGNGSIFCFGIFSPYMKQPAFSMSQTQINIVSTTGVVLSYFSLPTGFLFDRFGPKVTLLIGALLNLIGWLGMFTIFYDMEAPLLGSSPAVVSFFFGLSQWSASFYETGSVLTNLEAMSLHQGRVVIIQKTFMGLGSSIVTQLYIAFFQDRYSISTFFLFLAIFNASLGLLGAFHIRLPTPATRVLGLNYEGTPEVVANEDPQREIDPSTISDADATAAPAAPAAPASSLSAPPTYGALSKEDDDAMPTANLHSEVEPQSRSSNGPVSLTCALHRLQAAQARYDRAFTFGVGLLLVVVVFVVSLTILEAYYTIEGNWRYVMGVAMVLILLLFSAMIPLVPQRRGAVAEATANATQKRKSSSSSNEHDEFTDHRDDVAPLTSQAAFPSFPNQFHSERIPVESLNDKPLQRNLHMMDLKLMWLVSFAVWGTGTVVSANSSQIYQSLDFSGYTSALDSVYVSIYGVASAVGRVGVGFGDGYLKRRGRNVVRLFPIAPCINAVSIPLFFLLPAEGLIVAFFLSGLATGVTWGSTVLIIKSLFAPNNCGKHYNVLYTAGMLTPLLMNVALFGPLYDKQSQEQGRDATHTCSGSVCVQVPLLLSLVLNVAAIPCALLFARRVISNRGLS